MTARKAVIIYGVVLLTATAIGIYAVMMPVVESRQYSNRLYAASRPIQDSFRDLNESTELLLTYDPTVPEMANKSNEARILQLISTSRQQLALLKTVNSSLVPLPYANSLGQYNDALILRDHTQRFIGQTEDALSAYTALTSYLKIFDEVTDRTMSELNSFNSVSDINVYAGQSDKMLQVASRLRGDAELLSRIPHVSDTAIMHAAAVAAINEAANGFDDLAYGLAVPADDPIYAAARRIESATGELEKVRGAMYDDSLTQSRAIKNIQDLGEKMDIVLEA